MSVIEAHRDVYICHLLMARVRAIVWFAVTVTARIRGFECFYSNRGVRTLSIAVALKVSRQAVRSFPCLIHV